MEGQAEQEKNSGFKNLLPPSYDEALSTPSPPLSPSLHFLNNHYYQNSIIPDVIGLSDSETPELGECAKWFNPTLKPYPNFIVEDDVKVLADALTNGRDKNTIIAVLCQRTNDQRMEISRHYLAETGRNLIDDIDSHIKYYFNLLLAGLSMPYPEFLAKCIQTSISFNWLHKLLFTISNDEIRKMKQYFQIRFNCKVETFIETHIEVRAEEKVLLKPIISLLEACRNENPTLSPVEVHYDVDRIASMKPSKLFGCKKNEKAILTDIFYYKSFSHIRAVCENYHKKYKQPIFDVVERCKFSHGSEILCNIAKYAMNKHFYFAYLLKSSMKALGTDEMLLTHIVLKRSEIDLADINIEFKNLYQKSLEDWVRGYISGHYRAGIVALMDETRVQKTPL